MSFESTTHQAPAIYGGAPVRDTPMPARKALGSLERDSINSMLDWYGEQELDPGYQGHFEAHYCSAFGDFQGGGYADAVSSGTAALYVSIAALALPKGSHVLVSPITDPGTINAIILNGLKPKLLDSQPGCYNTSLQQIKERVDDQTTAVIIVHATGQAVAMQAIVQYCRQKQIKVIEDCSQSHGAVIGGQRIGTFGDIAAFSTMYRKPSITGPTGGVVYTRNIDLFHLALAHADRGKPSWLDSFDDRNPNEFLFPALNFHANEIACAIGLASLERLQDTINKRIAFVMRLSHELKKHTKVCRPQVVTKHDSPFILPIYIDDCVDKLTFAEALLAEGIPLNPHYQYIVAQWPWVKPYCVDDFDCPNARHARDRSFCLYLNEHYAEQEVRDIVAAIIKLERYFLTQGEKHAGSVVSHESVPLH